MPWINETQPKAVERIVAGLCYLTFGLVGLLYIIISGRSAQSQFMWFHFRQSIVLGILGLLLTWAGGIFISLLSGIMGMFAAVAPGLGGQITAWLAVLVQILVKVAYLLLVYGMIFAFLGKYAEIPFVSNIVRQMR